MLWKVFHAKKRHAEILSASSCPPLFSRILEPCKFCPLSEAAHHFTYLTLAFKLWYGIDLAYKVHKFQGARRSCKKTGPALVFSSKPSCHASPTTKSNSRATHYALAVFKSIHSIVFSCLGGRLDWSIKRLGPGFYCSAWKSVQVAPADQNDQAIPHLWPWLSSLSPTCAGVTFRWFYMSLWFLCLFCCVAWLCFVALPSFRKLQVTSPACAVLAYMVSLQLGLRRSSTWAPPPLEKSSGASNQRAKQNGDQALSNH